MDETELLKLATEADSRSKSNKHRLDKLEQEYSVIHSLATSVAVMAEKQTHMAEQLDTMCADVTAIKSAPADKVNTFIKAILTAAASALVGVVAAKFGII